MTLRVGGGDNCCAVPARPSITAFFPCYNDAGTIASMVITADRTLRELTDDYEIIVVNDASTDNSARDPRRAARAATRACACCTTRRIAATAATCAACSRAATKDLIFYTDGDAQYDPAELAELYAQPGARTSTWSRAGRSSAHDPMHRKIIGRVYHHFVKWWFGLHLRDVDCDFRLFRRHVLESFPLDSNSGCITVEMMTRIEQGGFRWSRCRCTTTIGPTGRASSSTFRAWRARWWS